MPESPPKPNEPTPATMGSRIRWDALAAIIAALIGLLALCVSGYTAYIQRQQVRAQVWPYLGWEYSGVFHRYIWTNEGVGPAIVKSVQVLVDGKPQQDWKSVRHTLQIPPFPFNQSTLNREVLSPGQTLKWIVFKQETDYENFSRAVDQAKVEFKVCYCSTLGDCWVNDSAQKDPRVPVGQCPKVPDSEQFDD